MTLCCPLKLVCLFSHENKKFVYLVCLDIKKSFNEDLSSLIKISSTKLHSAPLNTYNTVT